MRVDTVRVFVEVLEKDTPLVRRGQVARVTVDALPERSFAGQVTRFAPSLGRQLSTPLLETGRLYCPEGRQPAKRRPL